MPIDASAITSSASNTIEITTIQIIRRLFRVGVAYPSGWGSFKMNHS
jgi:hypothetical protein